MAAPNIAMVTASLERSLQNCSLSEHGSPTRQNHDDPHISINGSDASDAAAFTTLELNSEISLPYQWEQCLDLKTGEIYYIDWMNGTKLKDDPRTAKRFEGDCHWGEVSSDESEESACYSGGDDYNPYDGGEEEDDDDDVNEDEDDEEEENVLVVAGCKSCLMYLMLPKTADHCPKCRDILLHFNRPVNGYT